MASSNQDSTWKILTAVGWTVALISLGWGFATNGKKTQAEQQLLAATNEASDAKGQAQSLQTTNTEMLTTIGGPGSWNETKDPLLRAMQSGGVGNANQTVLKTLEGQRGVIDAATKETDELKKQLTAAQDKIKQLESIYENRVAVHDESKNKSEGDLQKLVQERDELLQGKDKEITSLKEDLRRALVEKEQVRENAERTENTLNSEVQSLTAILQATKQRLEEVLKVSFEVPDGQIVSVDANLGIVYINLGTLDNLRPQISFSVYSHDHRGIGREARDIKASIEVTRILGPHLAEAKILSQDRTRPISADDPIYSPIWAGGRSEYFAFVGLIDFDKDGKSDRDTLHRLLKGAKAEIELEIDDQGQRLPAEAKLTENTKFLVLGEVPDPTNFASGDPRYPQVKAIMEQMNALLKEANLKGVRVVKLSDFMAYMGFQSQLRTYIPGKVDRFTLEQGARGSSVRSDDATGQQLKSQERFRELFEKSNETP